MTMGTQMTQMALRQLIPAVLFSIVLVVPLTAQEFSTGDPIGATNEAGVWQSMSDNEKVFGSFHFSESCTLTRTRISFWP